VSIVQAIEALDDLDDIEVLRRAFARVLEGHAGRILHHRRKTKRQVGFLNEIGYKNKRGKKQFPCNGIVVKVNKDTVDIKIVAPVKFADKVVRMPKEWVCEPFDIVEKEFTRTELPPIDIGDLDKGHRGQADHL